MGKRRAQTVLVPAELHTALVHSALRIWCFFRGRSPHTSSSKFGVSAECVGWFCWKRPSFWCDLSASVTARSEFAENGRSADGFAEIDHSADGLVGFRHSANGFAAIGFSANGFAGFRRSATVFAEICHSARRIPALWPFLANRPAPWRNPANPFALWPFPANSLRTVAKASKSIRTVAIPSKLVQRRGGSQRATTTRRTSAASGPAGPFEDCAAPRPGRRGESQILHPPFTSKTALVFEIRGMFPRRGGTAPRIFAGGRPAYESPRFSSRKNQTRGPFSK